MQDQGWIKLYRSVTDSFVFQNPDRLKFWIWCLCKATHKDRTQPVGLQTIELKKGQFVFGRKKAAAELNMDESKVYRFLKSFEKRNKIEVKSNNKFSVVSIANWESYQDYEQQSEHQMNNKPTTNEQQMNTNKNVKNVKNNIYIESIVKHWNGKPQLSNHKSSSKSIVEAIETNVICDMDYKYVINAIDNYYEGLTTDFYYTHSFKLDKFISQSNGYRDWSGTGKRLKELIDHRNKKSFGKAGPKPKYNSSHNFSNRGVEYSNDELEKKLGVN